MNNQTTDNTPRNDPQPKPLYHLARRIAVPDRRAEANRAREAANHLAATMPPNWKVRAHGRSRSPDPRDSPAQP